MKTVDLTPIRAYKEALEAGQLQDDPQQRQALKSLEICFQGLLEESRKRSSFLAPFRSPKRVRGVYLWGGVGIGKTFLMDCFYGCLPFAQKKRQHFHQLMRFVQEELQRLQGQPDPLALVAKSVARECLVLCLDELVVSDITDAMLLGRLFTRLFAEGVTLLATSNQSPDDLYKNGLQRQHFLPVIALLKQEAKVLHLTTQEDYRLRHLKQAGVFYIPNNASADESMEKSFQVLAQAKPVSEEAIELYGRKIAIKKEAGEVIWFDFKSLCSIPRSQQDFLALAEKYNTVMLSDIPVLQPEARDKVSLFIRLVDVLYDARVRLVLSAETVVDKIYTQGRMAFEYQRAVSRLVEMQSEAYFLNFKPAKTSF